MENREFDPWGVFDDTLGLIAVCEASHVVDVATRWAVNNYPVDRVEDCEHVWVARIEPDTLLV